MYTTWANPDPPGESSMHLRHFSHALLLLTAAALLSVILGEPAQGGPLPRIGLWIECEGRDRTLDSPDKIRAAVEDASSLGATDIFLQVYRNGTAWFQTSLADDTPFRKARAAGFDPVGLAVTLAHRQGIRIHAWVNVLRVDDGSKSRLVRTLGEQAVLGDSTGRSLLAAGPWGADQGWKPDTPGAWLDPGSPEVVARLAAIFADLLGAHPALDGLHLDYVRYPMAVRSGKRGGTPADLGWSRASRARFVKKTANTKGGEERARWDAWRADQLTALVRSINAGVRKIQPELVRSAAVIPAPDEALGRAHQNWPAWTRDSMLDLVVPMNYTRDAGRFERLSRSSVEKKGRATMLIGVGAWRFRDRVGEIPARIRLSLEAGAEGVVLFSHNNLGSWPTSFGRLGRLIRQELREEGTPVESLEGAPAAKIQ